MIKIVLVDDHQVILDGLKVLLPNIMECEIVGEALSGKMAIEKIKTVKCDVVIMDLSMPGDINGVKATEIIKSDFPEIKVLVLTMLTGFYSIQQVLAVGADGFTIKNSSADEIVKGIESILMDQLYIHPSLKDDFIQALSKGIIPVKAILSDMEYKIAKLISKGKTTKQIAKELFRSEETIKTHRKNLLKKFDCQNMPALIAYFYDKQIFYRDLT